MRPINFISANDVLPTDKYGRTSVLISDIAWTPNDQFVVISFSANYFCVLSRLGYPLNMLSANSMSRSIQHFYILGSETQKLAEGEYPHIIANEVYILG